jgi:hypothetical protein
MIYMEFTFDESLTDTTHPAVHLVNGLRIDILDELIELLRAPIDRMNTHVLCKSFGIGETPLAGSFNGLG